MVHVDERKTPSKQFQWDKDKIALLRREGLQWHLVLPLTIHQTLFPSVFQMDR